MTFGKLIRVNLGWLRTGGLDFAVRTNVTYDVASKLFALSALRFSLEQGVKDALR